MDDIDFQKKKPVSTEEKPPPQRVSVSAEVYGKFNPKKDFKPIVIPKTEEQKERIYDKLNHCFMFSGVELRDRKIIVNAMQEKRLAQGEYIIRQGDDGDHLYVVDTGELECRRKFVSSN